MFRDISSFSNEDRFNWLRLIRSQNVGSNSFFNLLKIFRDAKNAVDNLEDYAVKSGAKRPFKVYGEKEAMNELKLCQKMGAKIIAFPEESYPKRLREIPSPPPIITVLGNVELLNRDIIAIVGSRNSSANGCIIARRIAGELGGKNMVVASGLARGIDAAAHEGSLNTGTIAVIAGGIDNIYPKENTELYHKIAEKGIIISESPFGTPPKSSNFPQRNRIVSGMSLGVLVVEATLMSGSLITARCAMEQNREVFAAPGSPLDPRSQGSNRLIKQGAALVESAEDIMREIENIKERESDLFDSFRASDGDFMAANELVMPNEKDVEVLRKQILDKVNLDPVSIQEIIEQLETNAQMVNIAITQLELAGEVEVEYGRVVKLLS